MPDQSSPDRPDRRRHDDRRAQEDDRNRLLSQLDSNVTILNKSVDSLRKRLSHRPTAAELAFKRRRVVAAMLCCMFTIIFVHDIHVENCGPGARAEASIDAVINAPPNREPGRTLEEVQKLINQQPPRPLCDLTFPLHGHDGERFPSPGALAGGMLYLIGAVVLYLWARPRRRPQPAEEDL